MSLELIIGPSGSGKTTKQQIKLLERAAANPARNYLVLVPEQFNMQTQLDIVRRSPNKGIMNIDVLSFNRLAHRIFDDGGGNIRTPIDDCAKTMILRRIAAGVSEQLTVLAGKMDQSGYIDEVKSVISELMQYRISPDMITGIVEKNSNRPALVNKLHDIRILYQGFVDYLGEKYITTEELLEVAASLVPLAGVLKDCEIYLDGYTGFTPVQLIFLEVLLKKCHRVSLTVTLGAEMYGSGELGFAGKGSEEELFAMSQSTIYSMLEMAKRSKTEVEPFIFHEDETIFRFRNSPMLMRLERELFRSKVKKVSEEEAKGNDIFIAEAGSLREEAAGICRTIHRLVREKGYRYSEIAVLTGALEEYDSVLRQEMSRYEIPCFIDMRRNVLKNPLSELLRASLNMIVKGYSTDSVMRFLRCEVSGFSQEETDEIENYTRAVGIKRGAQYFEVWERRRERTSDEYQLAMERLRQRFADKVAVLKDNFGPRKKLKCADMLKNLYSFIYECRVYGYLKEKAKQLRESGDYARSEEYSGAYENLIQLLDHIMEFLGEEMLTVRELSEVIEAGLLELSVGILPPGNDQVIVGDIKRSRLGDIKVLFLMGANDGLIPRDEHKMGILSEMDRQVLKDQAVELAPGTREQAFIQRFYLYMYMTKASEKIYVSYSRTGADGSERAVSYIVSEIRGMFPEIEIQQMAENKISPITKKEGVEFLIKKITDGIYDQELFDYYVLNDKNTCDMILKEAFREPAGGALQKAVAKALYGDVINGNVTRLEKYARCAYAHFLKYGLKLREKEEYSFEVREFGTLCHSCMEEFGKLVREKGYTFINMTAGQQEEISSLAIEAVMSREKDSPMYDSPRSTYMEKRIRRLINRTIDVVVYQVQQGDFEPAGFEVKFGPENDVPSMDFSLDEGSISLSGTIDRIDIYETGNDKYFRIIDYKTGIQDFDFAKLYDGVSLQLPIYTAAALKYVENAQVGGMFYYHIDDPLLDRNEGEEESDRRMRVYESLRLDGIVNTEDEMIYHMDKSCSSKSNVIPVTLRTDGTVSGRGSRVADTAQLNGIVDYVLDKVKEIGNEMLGGNIEVKPYSEGDMTACGLCSYRAICKFDEYEKGYSYREKTSLSKEEIMDIMFNK